LDGIGGHHQIIGAPRHGIAIFSNSAGQKQMVVSQWAVDFIAKNCWTNVHHINTARARSFSPFNSKHKIGERINNRHSGQGNPAINDVIHAH
jgi:hypothetical protein